MSKIKVSELFYSVQGEGRYMGVPSIFLRTFGCNFRCKKFNRSKNEIIKGNNPEVDSVISNIDQYKTYESLPIINTGCDTYAAIYPEFKHLSPQVETDEIVDRIMGLLPYNKWCDEHLVITGGEPLLGWQRAYPALLSNSKMHGLKEITFETNGTQQLDAGFKMYLIEWLQQRNDREITFSVSAKLSVSGESREEAIRPDIVCDYEKIGYTYLKFVVATEDDAKEALEVSEIYRNAGFKGPIYLMPVGGVEDVYTLNNKNVALLAMKHGLRYSDRLQVPLFKNAWAT